MPESLRIFFIIFDLVLFGWMSIRSLDLMLTWNRPAESFITILWAVVLGYGAVMAGLPYLQSYLSQ